MRNSALQERRNRQILADLVRTYIETGEPVSSRAISKSFEETLSTATILNVIADLEDAGFLYQPHTSAGRVPTAAAYRFFAQEIASQATISVGDREWIQREMGGATSAAEITERAGHVLAEVSNGLGIIVSPPLDRKSTRLNSSHGYISYAVFCLKKKINNGRRTSAQVISSLQSIPHLTNAG